MPPIPIFLHTSLSSGSGRSRNRTPISPPIIIGRNRVAYVAYSIEDGPVTSDNDLDAQGSSSRPVNVYNTQHPSAAQDSSTSQHTANDQHSSASQHTAHNPASVRTTQNPPPSASSSTRKSRKAVAYNVNDLDPNNFITLIPKTLAIIDRCFPPTSPSSSKSPDHSSSLQNNSAPTVDRWSRDLDLGNYRSNNPSPQEVARAKIKEAERAKARVEAAALKRERAKRNPKRRASGGTVTRNQSPVDSNTNNNNKEGTPPSVTLNDSTTHIHSIVPPPPSDTADASASTSSSSQPFPPRNGMKRTRSAILPPISSNLSNSLGPAGAPGISSPLRAVTGPTTPEEGDQLPHKRSRLSDPTNEIPGTGRSTSKEAATGSRKASSHSPTSTTKPPLPIDPTPNTIPSATLQLPLSLNEESQSMRRAASASNIGVSSTRASRRSSFGVEALQARERSKREVVLPERLKDYDVRSTTPAWYVHYPSPSANGHWSCADMIVDPMQSTFTFRRHVSPHTQSRTTHTCHRDPPNLRSPPRARRHPPPTLPALPDSRSVKTSVLGSRFPVLGSRFLVVCPSRRIDIECRA